ncbi:hypothetical protein AVEN_91749-1 [Araneus ventricosus]|uniref:Tc1-like transposase DDE domain-containing protein n=1 Tax=Araneus ventricosus TaxID=182803 RepID=A0A4Y2HVB5_ARAVE|nr:hypothetical protein AVEN_91749-1 [Araneus ventricosus]
MERTRDPLPTLQCPRNRPLWRRVFNGLGRHHVGWPNTSPCLVFERGTVTDVRYRDEILEPYVRLFRDAVGPEFILKDDNARPYRALLVDEFLESEDIRRMDWPARSPDLNPIEHVWDALGRAIATLNPLLEPSRK